MEDPLSKIMDSIDKYKTELADKAKSCPQLCKANLKLVSKFFSQQHSPVDIAIIMDEGQNCLPYLSEYLSGNNLLLFRPKFSYRELQNNGRLHKRYLLGEPHPDRVLLLCDDHATSGFTIVETSAYFEGRGYQPEKTFSYLCSGCGDSNTKPLLGGIDELLDTVKKATRIGFF